MGEGTAHPNPAGTLRTAPVGAPGFCGVSGREGQLQREHLGSVGSMGEKDSRKGLHCSLQSHGPVGTQLRDHHTLPQRERPAKRQLPVCSFNKEVCVCVLF